MLEIHEVFWFENILVSRMISAIIYDCLFIADLHNPIKFKISICYLNMSLF